MRNPLPPPPVPMQQWQTAHFEAAAQVTNPPLKKVPEIAQGARPSQGVTA
jgi:hypothetical protein